MHDIAPDGQPYLSKHRIEALIDGIFAVAMTLLVIDLRLPEHARLGSNAALADALAALLPNFASWLISFVVLALFWASNHRLYHHVRHVDTPLLWYTILMLGGASLLPFASAVNSQSALVLGQTIYAGTMMVMACASLLMARHIHRHPALCAQPMAEADYRATRTRLIGLLLISALTVVCSHYAPGTANFAYLLMFALRPLSRRIARHGQASAAG